MWSGPEMRKGRFVRLIRRWGRRALALDAAAEPDVAVPYEVLGSSYGGWPVIDDSLNRNSVVYSFGLGQDITFDLALIKRYGCTVYGFDPTPRSLSWLAGQQLPSEFRVMEWGLAARDGSLDLCAPARDDHVSFHCRGPGAPVSGAVPVPVRRLATIMATLGHQRIDLIKMDIEGCEYEVLEDMIASNIIPHQILVEFHHRMYDFPLKSTVDAIDNLRRAGGGIFYISDTGREYGFVRTQPFGG